MIHALMLVNVLLSFTFIFIFYCQVKYAYVTFAEPTIDYSCGVIQLGYGLKRMGTPFDLVVMVPKEMGEKDRKRFQRNGWIVIEVI